MISTYIIIQTLPMVSTYNLIHSFFISSTHTLIQTLTLISTQLLIQTAFMVSTHNTVLTFILITTLGFDSYHRHNCDILDDLNFYTEILSTWPIGRLYHLLMIQDCNWIWIRRLLAIVDFKGNTPKVACKHFSNVSTPTSV